MNLLNEPTLIDCHAHFYPPNFTLQELDLLSTIPLIHRPKIVVVPETFQESRSVLEICKTRDWMYPCIGVHPVQPTFDSQGHRTGTTSIGFDDVQDTIELIRHHQNDIVGIGEIGLDFSLSILDPQSSVKTSTYKADPRNPIEAIQISILSQFAQLGQDLNLTLNVHSRNAGHYAIDTLKSYQVPVLFHAFDGKAKYALDACSRGHMFSVPPCVVRSPTMQNWVKQVPLDHLVLETDSPALSHIKGETNHPRNLFVSVEAISKIKGIPLDQVRLITTQNALKLFPKLKS